MTKEGIGCKENCQEDCGILDDYTSEITELGTKVTELECIIIDSKECVKITQEENDKLRAELRNYQSEVIEARQGVFGFMILAEETLRQGMVRNYQEFHDECLRLNKQIVILKEMILKYQMSKLCWCDKCSAQRSMSDWKKKLETELNALIVVKEMQSGKKKHDNRTIHSDNGLVSGE